jgi:FtsH-binding integral membrane protein
MQWGQGPHLTWKTGQDPTQGCRAITTTTTIIIIIIIIIIIFESSIRINLKIGVISLIT